jgi:hypothetical protein
LAHGTGTFASEGGGLLHPSLAVFTAVSAHCSFLMLHIFLGGIICFSRILNCGEITVGFGLLAYVFCDGKLAEDCVWGFWHYVVMQCANIYTNTNTK